jgi:hypothetical protein
MTTFTQPDADGPSRQNDLFMYVEGLLGLSHSHRIPLQDKYKQGEAPNLWIIQSFSREYPEGNLKVHMDVTTDDYFKDWALSETGYYYTKQHRVTSGSSHGYGGLPNIDDTNIAVLNSELGDWIKNGSETAERLVVGTSKNRQFPFSIAYYEQRLTATSPCPSGCLSFRGFRARPTL